MVELQKNIFKFYFFSFLCFGEFDIKMVAPNDAKKTFI